MLHRMQILDNHFGYVEAFRLFREVVKDPNRTGTQDDKELPVDVSTQHTLPPLFFFCARRVWNGFRAVTCDGKEQHPISPVESLQRRLRLLQRPTPAPLLTSNLTGLQVAAGSAGQAALPRGCRLGRQHGP